jgi:hypothetical protein
MRITNSRDEKATEGLECIREAFNRQKDLEIPGNRGQQPETALKYETERNSSRRAADPILHREQNAGHPVIWRHIPKLICPLCQRILFPLARKSSLPARVPALLLHRSWQ